MNGSVEAGGTATVGAVDSGAVHSGGLTPGQRLFSLAELALGGAVVVAYNVYHVIPNEVYVLVVMGLISLRLRDGGWSLVGLGRPRSWRRTIVIGTLAAAVRILLGALVVDPLTAHFWPSPADAYGFDEIRGNVTVALHWLFVAWSFAAFGEEISYRGYLLTRAADVGNRSKGAYWIGLLAVSVLFGIGHYYKGPPGMIDSGTGGLVFGAAYLLSGCNLWVSILAHGLVDTFGVVALFFGWAT
jgi:CAAX protease family protein